MEFMKKQSAGFYFTVITLILSVAALIAYMINCNTSYFGNLGVHPAVAGGMIVAIAAEAVLIIGTEKMGAKKVFDILPILSGVCLMMAFAMFISVRVAGIASIMTFEKNAQTTADMNGAIVGMVLCVLAALFCMISSFFRIVKED